MARPSPETAPSTVASLRRALPRGCLRPNAGRALLAILQASAFLAVALIFAAWIWTSGSAWLAPASWLLSGTAFMSAFVLGHDCGHQSLTPSRTANTLLGHLLLLPAGFPFHAWRLLHDAHHRHANLLGTKPGFDFDAAWNPMTLAEYRALASTRSWRAWRYRWIRRLPLLGSIAYLLHFHFAPWRFPHAARARIYVSYGFLAVSGAGIVRLLWGATGAVWLPLLHFWAFPALVFHGWLALYTLTQHVSTQTAFHPPEEWTSFRGQVESTLDCRYPAWISFLHGHIDYHVVHHVSPAVPHYHLPRATRALLDSAWGEQVKRLRFRPGWFLRNLRQCQLWDTEARRYVSFAAAARSPEP